MHKIKGVVGLEKQQETVLIHWPLLEMEIALTFSETNLVLIKID